MRPRNMIWIAAMGVGLIGWGCANPANKVLAQYPTMMSIKPAKGYIKKVAMVQAPVSDKAFDRRAGDLYFNTLTHTLRREAGHVHLLTSEMTGFPEFMAVLPHSSVAIDAAALARAGRLAGFNGLITTALRNIRPMAYKSGILWFRKTKYRIVFEVTLDLYDPFTAAKILSRFEKGTVKIDRLTYDDLNSGVETDLTVLDEQIVDMAEDLGERAAEAMAAHPWQAAVVRVDGTRLFLATGGPAGVKVGRKMAVIDGKRTIDGQQGETFIVPGVKVGEIVITAVGDQEVEARSEEAGQIKVGDIAVPIR